VTDVLAGGLRPAHSTVDGSPFPPIAEHAFLSDCEVCALVAPSGGAMPAGLDLHAGTTAGQDHSAGTGQ
jgi:hypothetical protein